MEGNKIKFFFIYTFVIFFSHEVTGSRYKVVIDQDGNADDAMALFITLLREQYFDGPEVVGITISHGGVSESQAFINTQRILDVMGRRDIPIYRGISSSFISTARSNHYYGQDGLGDNDVGKFEHIRAEPELAPHALIELSKRYPDNLIVLALAPLTNIAMAVKIDPGFIRRLNQLIIGSGNIYSRAHPKPEFNVKIDPEAYYIVAKASEEDRVTIIPWAPIQNMNITRNWRENVLGTIRTKVIEAQNSFEAESWRNDQSSKWALLDPAVASILVEPRIIEEYEYSDNSVILCGQERGIVTNKFVKNKSQANSNVVTKTDTKLYKSFLIETFSAQLVTGH